MEDNKKTTTSLTEVLTKVLGADFDAEKTKALESEINAYMGSNTVPKNVFNDKNSKLKELKAKLQERADKQKDSSEWQKQIDTLNENHAKELKAKDDLLNDYRLTQALKDGKAKNPKAVKALLDLTKLTFNPDTIDGLEEQLNNIKQDNDYMFDIPANAVQKGTGGFPAANSNTTSNNQPPKPKVI